MLIIYSYIRHSKIINGSYNTFSWTVFSGIKFSQQFNLQKLDNGFSLLPPPSFNEKKDMNCVFSVFEKFKNEITCSNSLNIIQIHDFGLCSKILLPAKIFPFNPGNNLELQEIMIEIENKFYELENVNYIPTLVDINIYWRMVRKRLLFPQNCTEWEMKNALPILGIT